MATKRPRSPLGWLPRTKRGRFVVAIPYGQAVETGKTAAQKLHEAPKLKQHGRPSKRIKGDIITFYSERGTEAKYPQNTTGLPLREARLHTPETHYNGSGGPIDHGRGVYPTLRGRVTIRPVGLPWAVSS